MCVAAQLRPRARNRSNSCHCSAIGRALLWSSREQQQDNQIATGHPRLRPSGFTPNQGRHMSSRSGRGPRFGGDGSTAPPKVPQNEILAKLPSEEFARFQEHASEAQFALRDELFEPGDTLERVYFPLNVMFSLINVLDDGTAVEV